MLFAGVEPAAVRRTLLFYLIAGGELTGFAVTCRALGLRCREVEGGGQPTEPFAVSEEAFGGLDGCRSARSLKHLDGIGRKKFTTRGKGEKCCAGRYNVCDARVLTDGSLTSMLEGALYT